MPLFGGKVPNTVSDKKMRQLQERAAKANKRKWTDEREIKKRLDSRNQRSKSIWS